MQPRKENICKFLLGAKLSCQQALYQLNFDTFIEVVHVKTM